MLTTQSLFFFCNQYKVNRAFRTIFWRNAISLSQTNKTLPSTSAYFFFFFFCLASSSHWQLYWSGSTTDEAPGRKGFSICPLLSFLVSYSPFCLFCCLLKKKKTSLKQSISKEATSNETYSPFQKTVFNRCIWFFSNVVKDNPALFSVVLKMFLSL